MNAETDGPNPERAPGVACSRLLECCFGIRADDPNWKCREQAKWRNHLDGRPTDLMWCDEHKPTESQYPHVVEAL